MTAKNTTVANETKVDTVTLTIDGQKVEAPKGATVLEAALGAGIYIPTLCYDPDLNPYGACRLCITEIDGMRGLVTSCTTRVAKGMKVHTETPKVNQSRRTTMELIMANHPAECLTCAKNGDCELQKIARYLGIEQEHFERLRKSTRILPIDDSHPAFIRDHNKCILCARCVRACQEIAGVGAIDLAFRGFDAKVATFGDKPLLESICKSCAECVSRCPTGALVPKHAIQPSYEVKTVCPYCGVGCSMYLGVRSNKIVSSRGDPESPVNKGGLCVKGRFGYDFTAHPDRLTTPLIRNEGHSRDTKINGNFQDVFRQASWDEALDLAARKLSEIKEKSGPDSIGVLSSAKFTNEENYAMQKFARAVINTNNIDHCARLCHASTVVGAQASFGSGAMSNSISDIANADLVFVIGSNTTSCHPIIGRYIRQSAKFRGTKLIVADPRNIDLAQIATMHLAHKPGTDVALINGMMNVIISEGLHDAKFVEERTEGFEELAEMVKKYTPQKVQDITGVEAEQIVEAARMFAKAESAVLVYSMGITQHTTGVDNVMSTGNLLMLTGNMGRENTGFSPLRGQNNVQGSCDVGALPNVFPGYQRIDVPETRGKFESAWGVALSENPGIVVTEMFDAISDGKIKAMYIAGENPMLSEPDLGHVRQALEKLEFMVVQDIFPTETAIMADIILPAAAFAEKDGTFTSTERRVQKLRKVIDPPGEAKPDWEITSMLAQKMGVSFGYESSAQIMDEIASLTPIYGGIHHDRLEEYGLQWPCPDSDHPGTPILHVGKFTRGKGKFHALEYKAPAEAVSDEYPFILSTGRVLEHWHTGTMTRRSEVLDELYPQGKVDINPDDASKLGITDSEIVSISSKRGKVEAMAHITSEVSPGILFMAFHWKESAANELTNAALDPVAKIPEYKVSAVKVEKL